MLCENETDLGHIFVVTQTQTGFSVCTADLHCTAHTNMHIITCVLCIDTVNFSELRLQAIRSCTHDIRITYTKSEETTAKAVATALIFPTSVPCRNSAATRGKVTALSMLLEACPVSGRGTSAITEANQIQRHSLSVSSLSEVCSHFFRCEFSPPPGLDSSESTLTGITRWPAASIYQGGRHQAHRPRRHQERGRNDKLAEFRSSKVTKAAAVQLARAHKNDAVRAIMY